MDGRRSKNPQKKEKEMRNAIRGMLAGLLVSVPGVVVAYILGHVAYAVTR